MIAIHINKVIVVQKKFLIEIEDQRKKALYNLNQIQENLFTVGEIRYLNKVKGLYEDRLSNIILISPDDIKNEISILKRIPMNSQPKGSKSLKNYILDALNYKSLRTEFYPKYFKEIGIKACVYCNSQLTIAAVKNLKNEYSAKFDVDHYHSKDYYPFLSICLFNLYPTCASCNRLKSRKKVEFELYSDELSKTSSSSYKFKLDPYAKAKFLTTKSSDGISFVFQEPIYSPGITNFNELFHIEEIYKTQYDIIEELIIKSQIYNRTYLKTLKSNFSKLSLHPELFKRTLVGNYTDDRDLHKRPMSKLMMDIAKDLELI